MTRSPRMLVGVCAALVVGAGALWAGSATTWLRALPPGRSPFVLSGAEVAPALTGIALVALAGVAGVVATGGLFRRLVGLVLIGAATWAGGEVAPVLVRDPADIAGRVRGVPLAAGEATGTAAALLAVAGVLLLLAAGVAVLLREPRLPRFGARYAAAGDRPRPVHDPDRTAWTDLDEGRDPTVDPAPDTGPGRGDDPAR